eukprot:scaffold58473_cov23-Tisochrysis_lutea.AAC.1
MPITNSVHHQYAYLKQCLSSTTIINSAHHQQYFLCCLSGTQQAEQCLRHRSACCPTSNINQHQAGPILQCKECMHVLACPCLQDMLPHEQHHHQAGPPPGMHAAPMRPPALNLAAPPMPGHPHPPNQQPLISALPPDPNQYLHYEQ